MSSQIPSAFVIRALARGPAEHCDRCGHRMFVKQPSGLCPFCRAGQPVRPVAHAALRAAASEPFAPLLRDPRSWQPLPIGQRVRDLLARSRRRVRPVAVTSTT